MVTFSDLVMLLLTFFVLLLTMSSLDRKSLKELFSHQKESPGVLEFSGYGEIQALARLVNTYNKTESKIVVDQTQIRKMILPAIESAKK